MAGPCALREKERTIGPCKDAIISPACRLSKNTPPQGIASMTTRKQVAIVMLAMFALFALGQLCLLTLPFAG
jgi:hypothetical protein